MNDPSEEPPESLDYKSSQRMPRSHGWFDVAIMLAGMAGVFVAVTIGLMLAMGLPGFGALAIVAVVVVTAIAFASYKMGMSATLAIVIASGCAGLLAFSICAGGVIMNTGVR